MKKSSILLCIGLIFFGLMGTQARSQGTFPVDVSAHFETGEKLVDIENRLIFLAGEVGHPARSGALMLIDALVSVDRVFPLENPPRVAVNLNISIPSRVGKEQL